MQEKGLLNSMPHVQSDKSVLVTKELALPTDLKAPGSNPARSGIQL